MENYQEEVVPSLASAGELAVKSMQQARKRYKIKCDHNAGKTKYQIGDWVLVKFPHEETGKQLNSPNPFCVVTIQTLLW